MEACRNFCKIFYFLHKNAVKYCETIRAHTKRTDMMTAWYFNGTFDYETFFNGNLNYENKIYGKHFYALYFYS
jgi:hypothetical protein